MTERPEALYLADMLESDPCEEECFQAAALLDRQHAEIERLRAALRWIATVNAMDYEYQVYARAALKEAK